MNDGLFVTMEGIDGAGKSTVVDSIAMEYDDVVTTSEPTDYWTGDQVYRAISEKSSTPPLADFFLYMADRVHHIQNRIKPALENDKLVVSDRFADSTRAYQTPSLKDVFGQNFAAAEIDQMMEPWNLEPDLTIYLDISVDTALERMDGEDQYEKEEFLKTVKEEYERVKEIYDYRFVEVDAEEPETVVKQKVLNIIDDERD